MSTRMISTSPPPPETASPVSERARYPVPLLCLLLMAPAGACQCSLLMRGFCLRSVFDPVLTAALLARCRLVDQDQQFRGDVQGQGERAVAGGH